MGSRKVPSMAVVESQAGRKYCASFEQMCDRSKSARESATLCSAHTAHRKLQAQHSQSTLLKSFHLNSLCPNYQSSRRQSRRARAWPWDSFAAAGAEGERGTDAYTATEQAHIALVISQAQPRREIVSHSPAPFTQPHLASPHPGECAPPNQRQVDHNVWSTDGSHSDFHHSKRISPWDGELGIGLYLWRY